MQTAIFHHSDALASIIADAQKRREPILLVHDQGLYLMTRTLREPDGERAVCAYAEGCDPAADGDWWDRARDLVGGDDFVEEIGDFAVLAKIVEGGAGLAIDISESHLSIRSAASVH